MKTKKVISHLTCPEQCHGESSRTIVEGSVGSGALRCTEPAKVSLSKCHQLFLPYILYLFLTFSYCLLPTAFVMLSVVEAFPQGVGINPNGIQADPSAGLDVNYNNKGLLIPRLTTVQRDAISNPALSLMVFNITDTCLQIWMGTYWHSIACDTATAPIQPPVITTHPVVLTICAGANASFNVTATGAGLTYQWQEYISSWNNLSNAGIYSNVTTATMNITGATAGMNGYQYRCIVSGTYPPPATSNAAVLTVADVPVAPTAGTNSPSQTQIVWNWNTVSGATGYKWNTINDYATATDNGAGISYTQTSLTCNTAYTLYVWAYNTCGNSPPVTLSQTTSACSTCGNSFVDVRDGQTYTTVLIGAQCWMKQNLNIGTMVNNAVETTDNGTIEKYCYNNTSSNCTTYGGLYQWAEMVQYYNGASNTASWSSAPTGPLQGICPAGWHLPTDAEWTTLMNLLGGSAVAGGEIKETGLTHWNSPNTGATNSSGFTAFGGGFRYANPSFGFSNLKGTANFWSCSEGSVPGQAWNYIPSYNWAGINIYDSQKALGYTVRCIKD